MANGVRILVPSNLRLLSEIAHLHVDEVVFARKAIAFAWGQDFGRLALVVDNRKKKTGRRGPAPCCLNK